MRRKQGTYNYCEAEKVYHQDNYLLNKTNMFVTTKDHGFHLNKNKLKENKKRYCTIKITIMNKKYNNMYSKKL